jgi:chromosome segregation ATPase
MADMIFLNSKAKGTWEYEIEENKIKVKYPIVFGFNEIPESHMKTLEENPGFKFKIKKEIYKVLNKKQAMVADKTSEKKVDAAKELKQVKEICKAEIVELKKEHEKAVKKNKVDHASQTEALIKGRGEALQKVKELEKEVTTLKGELANIGDKHKQELDNMKAASDKETEKFMDEKKVLEDAKTALGKEISGLKTEKKDLEKQLAALKKAK